MENFFRPAILYVDDEPANLTVFQKAFSPEYLVKTCLSAQEAMKILKEEDFPLVIADQKMPGMTGIELFERLIMLRPQTMRFILTAYSDTQLLLDAIHRGHVHDYIVKPWKKSELKPILEKAFADYKERLMKIKEFEARAAQADRLTEEIREIYDFEALIGAASGLREVVDVIQRAAPTDSTVLILGETGTGKELVARAIHENSRRKKHSFVAVHCAALTPSLLESELFGHEKGAFTGAEQERLGRFEMADGGTLFLDEIGEIPENIQVKLLRVLQEKEIQRVGGSKAIPVNIRVLGATNKDLGAEVRAGKFRKDLYYRLNVVPILVPPLRERIQDVPPLADYFLRKFNRQIGRNLVFSEKALEQLRRYDWPGNVREIQNIVERAVILSGGPEIESEDLKLNVDECLKIEKVDWENAEALVPAEGSVRAEIRQQEARKLLAALRQACGNTSEAARILGVARSTLFDRLKKYRLI